MKEYLCCYGWIDNQKKKKVHLAVPPTDPLLKHCGRKVGLFVCWAPWEVTQNLKKAPHPCSQQGATYWFSWPYFAQNATLRSGCAGTLPVWSLPAPGKYCLSYQCIAATEPWAEALLIFTIYYIYILYLLYINCPGCTPHLAQRFGTKFNFW